MNGVDTNVIIRYLVADDEAQAVYRGWAREQHVKQFPLIRPLHKK